RTGSACETRCATAKVYAANRVTSRRYSPAATSTADGSPSRRSTSNRVYASSNWRAKCTVRKAVSASTPSNPEGNNSAAPDPPAGPSSSLPETLGDEPTPTSGPSDFSIVASTAASPLTYPPNDRSCIHSVYDQRW